MIEWGKILSQWHRKSRNLSAGAGQVAAVQRLGRLNREQGPPGPTPKEG
jgi:hypothetical protein